MTVYARTDAEGTLDASAPAHALVKQSEVAAEGGILQAPPPAASPEGPPSEDEYPRGLALLFILLSLVLSIVMVAVDQTIIATAIPLITDEFHSVTQIGWYGSAFFLEFASFTSSWGKLFKYFRLQWTFLVAVFLFELGSLVCAVAPSSTALIVGRALAGLGAAGVGRLHPHRLPGVPCKYRTQPVRFNHGVALSKSPAWIIVSWVS